MVSFDQPALSLGGLAAANIEGSLFFLSVSCGFLLSLDLKDFLRFSSGGSCLFLTCSFASLDLECGCCLDLLPCSEMSFLSAYCEFLLISEEEKRDKQCQGKG